jgi:hypothetical protein
VLRILSLLLTLALALACTPDDPAAGASEEPAATADCDAVETVPIQGEGHLVGDQRPPVPYNSTPPTSGWHTATDVPIVSAPEGQPLTEPELVTVLELGGVVVAHNGLDGEAQAALEALIADKFPGQVAATSYDKLAQGDVALVAWGRLQPCTALDLAAVEAFAKAYAQR